MPKRSRSPRESKKAATGITGFDDLTEGGLPAGRATFVMGGTGSGKTVFALQCLTYGARHAGEPGIFVAFEENAAQLRLNARGFTWWDPEIDENLLSILDARVTPDLVTAGDFDVIGMLEGLKLRASEMGAKRIVFDSVDVLLALLDDPSARRQEAYRIYEWLFDNKLTGIITMKSDPDLPGPHGYDFMQFRSDCVVLLTRRSSNRFSMRELQVIKYRGSSHSEDLTPFAILSSGIEVASNSPRELEVPASRERVSTGIETLDSMLHGGYLRGSSVLLTGAPGTAKSILSGAFCQAACKRGEQTLLVSFDENADEIERNLSSVNILLKPHLSSGLLQIFAARTEATSAQVHLMKLKSLIANMNPRCVVIDPMSALIRAGGEEAADVVAERLLYLTRARGITAISTSIVEDKAQLLGAPPLYVTTIVDTWIHLSYLIQGGERNRSLTVVKSRGVGHSNRVCEMRLSSEGILLRDVYVSQGKMIMGSLRAERQKADRVKQVRMDADIEGARQEVELAESEFPMRMENLRRQLQMKRAALEVLMATNEEPPPPIPADPALPAKKPGSGSKRGE